MLYPGISPASGAFGSRYVSAGCALSDVAARGAGIRGSFRAYRGAVAPRTQDPSSLSPLAFRRYTSAVRAGCANERQSGSVRGALGNRRPYRDLVVHDPRSDHGKTGNNVKVRVADRVLPRSGLKSNYDGGHFWGGAYSLDFGKPGVGRGGPGAVAISAALKSPSARCPSSSENSAATRA